MLVPWISVVPMQARPLVSSTKEKTLPLMLHAGSTVLQSLVMVLWSGVFTAPGC